MPFNLAISSYVDCRGAFERAVVSERGIKITCVCPECGKSDCFGCVAGKHGAAGAAVRLRGRLNKFRHMDRRESTKIYPEEHDMFGKSVYDQYILRCKNGEVFIELVRENGLQVEEL